MNAPMHHPDFPTAPRGNEPPRAGSPGAEPPPVTGIIDAEEWHGIGNEFTGVRFRKVRTANGERLQLFVPTRGYSALLDPMQLEIVAAQPAEVFSELHARQLGVPHARPVQEGDSDGRR